MQKMQFSIQFCLGLVQCTDCCVTKRRIAPESDIGEHLRLFWLVLQVQRWIPLLCLGVVASTLIENILIKLIGEFS